MLFLTFPSELRHPKDGEKVKIAFSRGSGNWFLHSRLLQKPFSKKFLSPKFDLNNFKRFALLSQITVLSSWFKNLQKTEKCPFQILRTFIFELQIAWELLSKRLPMINFWFKHFSTLCLTFPENDFNFVTQKFEKNC